MMLAATRRIPQTHADLAGGTWRGDYYSYDNVGPELEDSTVGLVGYGAIGSRVARMLAGFGAHVLVFDPYVTPEALAGRAEQVELDELLSRSTIVTLHARVTPETTGMIGAAQIAAMPAGSVIVNCARGALLDYDAVCDALDSGPPVRRRVRRLRRGTHPAGLAAADHAQHRHDPAPGRRQQGDRRQGGPDRRRRRRPLPARRTARPLRQPCRPALEQRLTRS